MTMNYIVMDLEWNQSYNGHMGEHPRMPFEIIEIGAVKVDKNLNIIDEYSSLIKPKIYKKLHSKIRTILNYDEDDLSLGRGFKEVCSEFLDWCGKDYIFCTWGPMDLTELQTNMDFYYMDKLPRPLKFLNLQSIYASVTNTSGIPQSMSKLEKAVSEMNIPENEPFHTALNDARYTALVMKEMKAKNINQLYSFDLYITPKNKEKEIENPFFETKKARESRKSAEKYGFAKPKNFISRAITRLVNDFKIAQYKRLNIVEPKPEIKPIIETPVVEIKPEVQKVKIDPKEEVRKNIFEILTSKLGEKTFAKQREAYGKNATKMRLGMLPEIFSSIADTRKADRAVGKHRINSSNKDALDLYLLINGSNKKYVNYLLKKRNADNSRMFEVKDIISMVKKAEAKIAEDKKINPEYRARDARKYYNHLYEAKLEQYGKAARQSKVNTKA